MLIDPEPEWTFVTGADRATLLSQGIVVLADGIQRRKRWVSISGANRLNAEKVARRHLGPRVDVTYVGEVPRRLEPIASTGYYEKEPGLLRVRYATTRTQHIDEILHAEDKWSVVVYATVCTPLHDRETHEVDCPHRVYLDAPLDDRDVIDGVSGEPIPYRNVLAEIAARQEWEASRDPSPLSLVANPQTYNAG